MVFAEGRQSNDGYSKQDAADPQQQWVAHGRVHSHCNQISKKESRACVHENSNSQTNGHQDDDHT